MIPVILYPFSRRMLYLQNTKVFPAELPGGKRMKKGREELEELREVLERTTAFIRTMEQDELPHFYRYFDTMKNNIELFIKIGSDDIEDFLPVLERDWKASHTMFIGVQNYDIRKEHPGIDPVLCIYFAGLLADIGRFFEYISP